MIRLENLQDETSKFISEYVKSDRKLLLSSVIELTKNIKTFFTERDYEFLLLEQNNPEFWKKKNLEKFYDFYLQLWNERRLSKLN